MSNVITKAKSLILRKETKTAEQMMDAFSKAQPLLNQKEGGEKGYRSKLVICIDILCNLVYNGPMTMVQLLHRVELDTIRFTPHLRLLIDRGLIEQNVSKNEKLYAVTERGIKVLKVISPILKEAYKIHVRDFEAISSVLSEAGYPEHLANPEIARS